MDNPAFLDEETKQELSQMAEEFADSEASNVPPDPLHPQSLVKLQIKDKFEKQITEFYESVLGGLVELVNTVHELSEKDPQVNAEEIMKQIPLLKEGIAKLSEDLTVNKSLRELSGISQDTMSVFNKAAAYLYEAKLWDRAAKVYAFLTFIEPNELAFAMGLGNCEYFSKKFENALHAYAKVAKINPQDPHCHFYSAHCHHELNDIDKACDEANQALTIIKHDNALKEWQPQAEELKLFFNNMKR